VDARPLGPRSLVSAARRAGVAGCLLDTAVKDGRGLFEWLDGEALAALVAEAHGAGLVVALAGALRAEDLPAIRDTGADIAGVCRSARGGGASAPRSATGWPSRGRRAPATPATQAAIESDVTSHDAGSGSRSSISAAGSRTATPRTTRSSVARTAPGMRSASI